MINVQNIFIHFSNKSKLNIRISRIRWKVWTYAAFVRSFRSSCKYTTFYGLIYASTSTWFVYRLTILLSIFFFFSSTLRTLSCEYCDEQRNRKKFSMGHESLNPTMTFSANIFLDFSFFFLRISKLSFFLQSSIKIKN